MRKWVPAALALLLFVGTCNHTHSRRTTENRLTVFAAASLTRALGHDGQRHSFAGSQQLVAQIEAGAKADIVVTADERTMQRLVDAGLVERPVVVATNRLAVVVQAGNRKHVLGLADLARSDLVVVLADPSVPAGRYSADVLGRAGVAVRPKSLELDVEAVVQKVALGEADAGIAYVSDAASSSDITPVLIPDAQNVVARYPAAVLTSSRHPDQARRYIRSLAETLPTQGFGKP